MQQSNNQSLNQTSFISNWGSSSDCKKSDLAMMTPEEREEYEHHLC